MANLKAERRRSKRVPVTAKVPVRGERDRVAGEARTRDVSMQGVYIYMDTQVTPGSLLEVVLPLPSLSESDPETWVRCKCRVLRVEGTEHEREYGVAARIEEFEAVHEAKVPEN